MINMGLKREKPPYMNPENYDSQRAHFTAPLHVKKVTRLSYSCV